MPILQGGGYRDPMKAMTIKALEERRKATELAAMKAQQVPEAMPTPWHGLEHLSGILTSGMKDTQTANALAEKEGQRGLLLGNIDPMAGANQMQVAAMGQIDPELAMSLWSDRSKRLRDEADRENWQPLTQQERDTYKIDPADTNTYQRNIVTGEIKATKTGGDTNINVGGESDAFTKKLNEKEGERWSKIGEQATKSAAMKQEIDIMTEALKLAPQGAIPGYIQKLFPSANDAGTLIASINAKLAPALRMEGSGAQSDADLENAIRSLPSLSNNPAANRMIANMLVQKANINIEMGKIVDAVRTGTIDQRAGAQQMQELLARRLDVPPDLQKMFDDQKAADNAAGNPAGGGGSGDPAVLTLKAGDTYTDKETGKKFVYKGGSRSDPANYVELQVTPQ
jgi:hypothetical protein